MHPVRLARALRQLDPSKTAARKLDMYVYGIGVVEGAELPDHHSAVLKTLRHWGFKISPQAKVVQSVEGCLDYYREMGEARPRPVLDRGRGPVARVMVQDGTLHTGDILLAGSAWGKVRAMTDELGRSVTAAGPATPVEVLGLNEVPSAGDPVHAVKDARTAEEIAETRRKKASKRSFHAAWCTFAVWVSTPSRSKRQARVPGGRRTTTISPASITSRRKSRT